MNKFSFFLIIIFSLKAFFIFFTSQISSHELSPNIINFQIDKNRISIEFTTNLEAYLAGVDFSILDNTNDHDNEEYYKALRKLNNTELTKIFLKNWDKFVSLSIFGVVLLTNKAMASGTTPGLNLHRASYRSNS